MLVLTPSITPQGQQQINATFTQGDVVGWSFLFKIDDVPINLLGASIKMTIGMQTPVILSTENGAIVMTNLIGGEFLVNMPSEQTALFPPGTYFYEVWVKQNLASTAETQYIGGTVTVNPGISVFS